MSIICKRCVFAHLCVQVKMCVHKSILWFIREQKRTEVVTRIMSNRADQYIRKISCSINHYYLHGILFSLAF